MAERRLGAGGARALAGRPTLAEAVTALHGTPYGHDVQPDMSLARAQHAVGASLLWNIRVLAGWLPRGGAQVIRVLAAGFEVANLDEHLSRLVGEPVEEGYSLGSLETAWSRLADTTSLAGVTELLGTTSWRLHDLEGRRDLRLGIRLAWAHAVVAGVPDAAHWARAAAALLLLREVALESRPLSPPLTRRASSLLGPAFVDALLRGSSAVSSLRATLPGDSRWVLDGLDSVGGDLWRAEAAWWRRIEHDGFGLLRGSSFDQAPVVGAVAVLAADAWRLRAALEVSARGGSASAMEEFDVVA
jgi:hypothetical protein